MSQHQHTSNPDITTPAHDIHAGRPVAPEYRERGERLMREWAREDVFSGITYQEEK